MSYEPDYHWPEFTQQQAARIRRELTAIKRAWNQIAVVGTFTPVIEGTTTAGVGTYTTQVGQYTLVGDRCLFNVTLVWTGHTGTGNMRVGGLPFTSDSGGGRWPVASYNSDIALTAGHVLAPAIGVGASFIAINSYPSGGGAAVTVSIDTAGTLYLAGQYVIA